jgi:hypothetical protein
MRPGNRLTLGVTSIAASMLVQGSAMSQDKPVINQNVTSYNQSGGITAHTVVVGTPKLTFDQKIAEELLSKIPAGKPILLQSVGSPRDQAVADQYQNFLQGRGLNLSRAVIGMMSPPPDDKLSVADNGARVVVTIAPSAN